ncbi:hypothetical protein YC2023_024545 [Brassica napus]
MSISQEKECGAMIQLLTPYAQNKFNGQDQHGHATTSISQKHETTSISQKHEKNKGNKYARPLSVSQLTLCHLSGKKRAPLESRNLRPATKPKRDGGTRKTWQTRKK